MTLEYTKPTKILARKVVIESAIRSLTSDRAHSTLCRRSYVREVRDALIRRGGYDAAAAIQLTDEGVDRWEGFYDSIAQLRDARNLKVAYLCGPNPENDLRVFCAAGILPENVWAFESNASLHEQAVSSALSSEFPYIKVVKGGIDTFLENSPMRFDIIYLDFCGPLPSRNKKQKTLLAVSRILARHALNSPGALITNVSLPDEVGDPDGRGLIAKLVACYLYPKEFLEGDLGTNPEGPSSDGEDFEEWLKIVASNLENYYGQFITRVVMDLASIILPYNRISKRSPTYSNFFRHVPDEESSRVLDTMFHFVEDEEFAGGGDVVIDPGQHSLLWAFAALDKKTNAGDENYPQFIIEDPQFASFAESFLSQLQPLGNKDDLVRCTSEIMTFMDSRGARFLAPALSDAIARHDFRQYYQFCDLMLGHQVTELLFRQTAVPYHVNVATTRRWRYRAKETLMFMDMTILDECRYLYDWMPTTEMVSAGFSNVDRQLAYRFALDGVSKHRRWYNNEFFFGTAVLDQDTRPFEAKVLPLRADL